MILTDGTIAILDEGTLDKIDLLTSNPVVALDTETTGFTKTCQVIELSLVKAEGAEVLYSQRYRPTTPVHFGAQKVHGINFAQLMDKPKFNASTFHDWYSELEGNFLVTWNGSFDNRLICQTLEVHEAYEELELWKEYYNDAHVDLMQLVAALLGKKRLVQNKALELLGVEQASTQLHSAVGDCLNLLAILKKLEALAAGDGL